MPKTNVRKIDSTARDEMWCLIELSGNPVERTDQCSHTSAQGRYVVKNKAGVWCCFEPATKMQALNWINGVQARRERIRWECFECHEIMPLGSYDNE